MRTRRGILQIRQASLIRSRGDNKERSYEMKKEIKNKGIKCVAAVCLCASLAACGKDSQPDMPAESAVTESNGHASELLASASGSKRKVIIDTDTGADDASALILAAIPVYKKERFRFVKTVLFLCIFIWQLCQIFL